ncbi:MAG: response regulator transcription factor [Elusimicrobia bacterium]|nr:response regulator transcription factor [Elusimicrobiota bacterium]
MIEFALWLITPDRELADKWYRLFSRERLNVKPLSGLAAVDGIPQDAWGLAFINIGAGGLTSPRELKTLLGGRKNISIIVFSGPAVTTNPEISAYLEGGADDFILSDIDERVLLSKAKAHIRRLLPSLNLARTVVTSADGEIELEKGKRTVRLGPAAGRHKTLDGLTPKEFELLFLLLGSEASVVSRKTLMEEIWREKSGLVNVETIDKHVETLRRKLGAYGKRIKTVYGTGYIYKSRPEETL